MAPLDLIRSDTARPLNAGFIKLAIDGAVDVLQGLLVAAPGERDALQLRAKIIGPEHAELSGTIFMGRVVQENVVAELKTCTKRPGMLAQLRG